ncbi:hypothetical protein DM01DRAFT_1157242 [Hesseltinella vesiculosa]|uniref:Galactose oxidase n=1 Tax=Hesseltinella vesiculosa TaxID=101127 RepID=A0A1X2GSA5_9FUNG|nr:hypothetical protein DM01DRAFT_1157242 [Hesseltinella vesiculosa]
MIKLVFYFLLGIFHCQAILQENPPPTPRSFPACVLLTNGGSRVYCYGGSLQRNQDGPSGPSNEVDILDLSIFNSPTIPALTWKKSTFAYANAGVALASINNDSALFLYGGNQQWPKNNTGYIVSTTDNSIMASLTAANPMDSSLTPFIHESRVVTLQNGTIWMFGGQLINYNLRTATSSVFLFDPVSQVLTNLTVPTPGGNTRFGHTATLSKDGTKIYVIGGFIFPPETDVQFQQNNTQLTDIWVYDVPSSQWSTVQANSNQTTPPAMRTFHTTNRRNHC